MEHTGRSGTPRLRPLPWCFLPPFRHLHEAKHRPESAAYLRGFSFGPCFDFLGRSRTCGSSFIDHHSLESVFVFGRDPFGRRAQQFFIAQPGANARRREGILRGFHNARNDVFQEHVSQGDLRLREGVKPLQLFCQVVERCRYSRFELRCRLGVLTSAKLVCTSGDEECLLGPEATFFDSGANFFP